jgi:hypothetical protein
VDGICDSTYVLDSYNIDYLPLRMVDIPPSSITDLRNLTGATYINWTWTNPYDADFNYTMVFLNGTWKANISGSFFNATGLAPETVYEIETRTVDKAGNINASWVNSTAKTLPLSDVTSPIVTNPTASHEIPDDTDNEPLWGETAQLNVTVTDDNGVASVTVNLSEIGGQVAKPMTNMGDNIWSTTTNASAGTPPKIYNLTVNATDISGNVNNSVKIPLRVMKNGDTTGNGAVNIGDALRLANNVSYPQSTAYTLFSPYVADVTGNGIINIGDALRLANNVSYPGNPAYILK